ncbi:(2Fe-2S)-binding protein [Zavarzinia sp.]|uniref:(2Fe-2S)-binding protein n=1 Tax=Zavarzinia sp. TaxID=2027920 RepID=UPI0035629077
MSMVSLLLDGQPITAEEGANLGALLHRLGHGRLRVTESGAPRGLFCGMGSCFDCVVLVDGAPVRACLTAIRAGMRVSRTGGRP